MRNSNVAIRYVKHIFIKYNLLALYFPQIFHSVFKFLLELELGLKMMKTPEHLKKIVK